MRLSTLLLQSSLADLLSEYLGPILAVGILAAFIVPWLIKEIRETRELNRTCGPGCICGGENRVQANQEVTVYVQQPPPQQQAHPSQPQVVYLQAPQPAPPPQLPQVIYLQPPQQPQMLYSAPPQAHHPLMPPGDYYPPLQSPLPPPMIYSEPPRYAQAPPQTHYPPPLQAHPQRQIYPAPPTRYLTPGNQYESPGSYHQCPQSYYAGPEPDAYYEAPRPQPQNRPVHWWDCGDCGHTHIDPHGPCRALVEDRQGRTRHCGCRG